MVLLPALDSAVSPCLQSCPAFLQGHSSISSLTSPQDVSHSQQQSLSWDCSPVPTQPLCILEDLCPCLGYIGLQYRLFVWFSLHSDLHRSAASSSNSLKCLPFVSNYSSDAGVSPLLQFLHPMGSGPVLLTLFLFFPFLPSFYQVLRGSVYSFPMVRDSCQLSADCSTRSAPEDVFLMHPWREIYSTSTYSSAILSPLGTFFKCECLVLTYLPSTEFYQILISSSKK